MKRKKIILILLSFFITIYYLKSQSIQNENYFTSKKTNVLTWNKTFIKNNFSETLFSIIQTKDMEYMILGATDMKSSEESDIWIIKLDDRGNLFCDKTFGYSNNDKCFSIIKTSDRD